MEQKKAALTEEQQLRKARIKNRLFLLLVIADIALVGYLIYEMVSIFLIK